MFWVGLTGGIATGKSTVAAILQKKGIPVVMADRLAHAAMAPHSAAAKAIAKRFGASVLLADGGIDRPRLGGMLSALSVTEGAKARQDLESIVHPEVRKLAQAEREKLAKAGHTVAFYEVPLLFENNMQPLFDAVVCLASDPASQVARLMQRASMTEDEAKKRIQWQKPQAEKIAGSDFVIWNNGDTADLEKQVEATLVDLQNSLGKTNPTKPK